MGQRPIRNLEFKENGDEPEQFARGHCASAKLAT